MSSVHDINNILKRNYSDGAFHSHVSMTEPLGSFNFKRDQLDPFLDSYCQVVNKLIDNDSEFPLGIAEKTQIYMSVIVDADLKVEETDDIVLYKGEDGRDHIYSPEQVEQSVSAYQSVLRGIVEDCTDEQLTCCLLEKEIYKINTGVSEKKKTYLKNGFHLHFPYLFLKKSDQNIHLLPRVKDLIKGTDLFANLGYEDSSSIFDSGVYTVPWLMYGCVKEVGKKPYLLSKIFNAEGHRITIDKAFRKYQLFNSSEELVNLKDKYDYYLPRILSVIPNGRPVQEIKRGLSCPLKERMRRTRDVKTEISISVSHALEISARLLPMLADWRVDDRNEWMTIGWILYNIGQGSMEALDQWIDFSARSQDKFDEGVCIHEWDNMVVKDITLGTLKHYASIDSPEQYLEYKQECSERYKTESISGSHNHIAKLLYSEYGDKFICASIAGKTWFQFTGNIWEEIEEGVFLRKKISDELPEKYALLLKELKKKAIEDEASSKCDKDKLDKLKKLIANLSNCNFKNSVMKEASEVFYDHRFKRKLNADPYLYPFANGIYNAKLHIFRKGRPEDFISVSSPINYRIFQDTDEEMILLDKFLEQVFPDISLRKFFMDVAADSFIGGNFRKTLIFWLGEGGDNGKSITQNLFEAVHGPMSVKLPTQMLTGNKPATGAAFPELARALDSAARWATFEENEAEEEINGGMMKNITGADSMYARDLFEKGKSVREITPMFKCNWISNNIPLFKKIDKPCMNRVKILTFESTFIRPDDTNPAPSAYDEQLRQKRFPMDSELRTKIPKLAEAFAYKCLEHLKNRTDRIEPEKVIRATLDFYKRNDKYRQFIDECLIEDSNARLSLTEIYAFFQTWYKEGFPGKSCPIKNEIKEYFTRLWGKPSRLITWEGYRIRTVKDDIEDGNCMILNDEDLDLSEDDQDDQEDIIIEEESDETIIKENNEEEDKEEESIIEDYIFEEEDKEDESIIEDYTFEEEEEEEEISFEYEDDE